MILSAAAKQIETLLSDFTDDQVTGLVDELMLIDSPEIAFLYNRSIEIMKTVVALKELMMMYSCAMKEARLKLEILNIEYKTGYQRNPINAIYTRLKCFTSIMEKLKRNDIPFSLDNIVNSVNDVVMIKLHEVLILITQTANIYSVVNDSMN